MTDIDGLVVFLRARLDEDDAAARAAVDGPWWVEDGLDGEWGSERDAEVVSSQGRLAVLPHDKNGALNSDYIARHDPGRALREIEAKRRILDLHPHCTWKDRPSDRGVLYCDTCHVEDGVISPDGGRPCLTLRLLALPHAGHPGYLEKWKP